MSPSSLQPGPTDLELVQEAVEVHQPLVDFLWEERTGQ